ncbi:MULTISPECIES: gamma-glutamyltransferase family protein [Sphingobium]|jgi:gamma-glutamyltranspeptidase/glutathione hydrolase|uniref:Gamma-glutamyltranspeptidase n=1 Tax=Sphingobium fuliginis ATCC 27551 TaxID=1208342 RepID=A0A5B8CN90_SPHSA|nr:MULTISPECIES: gamma-glutamyltransferase family protein [Sphingobium]AJR23911.1 gamma-glutamyltranspeptidase [Sphingobium sp. YBL2]QDC40096.1 gamma-glutamyltranspeptidase [Sphingobium fuliginis ATCC 27551]UXC92870.1 gamma-glutamyltransferase family protein [Sphingobium sp. RSMS]
MTDTAGQGLSRRDFAALAVGGVALAQTGASAQDAAPAARAPLEPTRLVSAGETLRPEIVGNFGIVAAGRHYAVAAGTRILMAGGNATDAGVAAVFAAAVTEISHFGFGGEAPTIIYDAKAKKVSLVNGQGVAPMLATPDRFARAGVIPGNGPNGGTVPAMVDAMALALQLNGTMTLDQVLQPAIELADGFVMYNFLAEVFASQKKATSKWKDAYDTYYPGGALPKVGEIFRQPNLAKTIRIIAEADRAAYKKTKDRKAAIQAGRDAFYKGDIARRIGAAMERDGGLMRYEDLAAYKGKVETPTMTSVFGYEVYKGGFWSQGPAMLMALNIAEAAGIASMEPGSAPYLHIVAESIKLAFDDRNAFFGDPDFATVPMKGLLSKAYAAERAKQIGPKASLEHRYGDPWAFEGKARTTPAFTPHMLKAPPRPTADTTAIEVVDKDGNLFSATPSSGWLLGGAYIAGDTGVPMSNRLTVFDLDPESPNVLVPGKRPRTTLSPSMVLKNGAPYLAIGTPGGDNQDQQIMNVLLRVLAFDQPLQAAIEAPRINSNHFHASFAIKKDEPGVLEIENRVPQSVRDDLAARGHKLDVLGPFAVSTGIVAAGVVPGSGTLRGGADVRRERYVFGW